MAAPQHNARVGSGLVPSAIAVALFALGVRGAGADTIHVFEGSSIQAVIVSASDDDEIVVHPGIYAEAIDFLGKAIIVRSSDGASATTIDATGLNTSTVTCAANETLSSLLRGFTITGGTGTESGFETFGGGLFSDAAGPTVVECVFTGNSAYFGGGAYNGNGSTPTFTDCRFQTNSAAQGAGMCSVDSRPVVVACTFQENTAAASSGGGMANVNSDAIVTRCDFIGNTVMAGSYGGGVYNSNCEPIITACTFTDNWSGDEGGGLANSSSSPVVSGCVFTGNFGGDDGGGGMFNSGDSNPAILSCEFRDNTASLHGGAILIYDGTTTITDTLFCENAPDTISGSWSDGGANTFAEMCPEPCDADANGDGVVDVLDLLEVIASWGPCP